MQILKHGCGPAKRQQRTPFVLLTILFSLLAGARPAASADDPKESKWEKEIRAFEASDKTNPPPKNAIVFVGSSSIRLWKSLKEDFQEFPIVQRGFGGSQMADSVEFAERIVIPYAPRQVLVYAGDNDLAAKKSPEQVLSDFQAFVKKVHAALPKTRIAYIAIKPSSSRLKLMDKMKETNQSISDFTKKDERLLFIDTFTPILGPDGKPNDDLFKSDHLHLNEKGYAIWVKAIRPHLK